MSYLGRGVDKISNIETLDNITFNGASSYTLQKGGVNFVPTSAAAILISIDGVVQSGNFTVSSSTIDFGTAVAGTSTCNFIIHLGTGVLSTPSDGSVSADKLASSSVTRDKLNLISDSSNPSLIAKGDGSSQDGYIQLNCSQNSHGVKIKAPPHSAGQSYTLTLPQSITNNTFLKTDSSGNLSFAAAGGNTPVFQMRRDSDQTSITDNSAVKVIFNQDVVDTNSATDTSTGRFTVPSGEGGNYFLYGYVSALAAGQIRGGSLRIYKNGSATYYPQWQFGSAQSQGVYVTYGILNLSASDYVELYAQIDVDSGTSTLANSNGYNNIFGGFKLQ